MDNLTHTLTGLAVARAGLEKRTPGATLALVLASNIPDADLLFGLQGSASYLQHHRDLSHSVVGAPLLALALAVVLRLALRKARFLPLLAATLAGVAVHVFMDLWTSYGTRVLAPFDRTFYTWDLVFIVDPWLLLLLLATLLLARRLPTPSRVATVGLGLMLAYVGGRAVLHQRAVEAGIARVPGGSVVRAAALPTPLDPFRWRLLADTGSAYFTGEVNLNAPVTPLRRREKLPETAVVARVRETSDVAGVFLQFATFPWLEVAETDAGTEVVFRDLRFERPGRDSFAARVLVGPDGRIKSEAFRF
jgi:inner membrane protein